MILVFFFVFFYFGTFGKSPKALPSSVHTNFSIRIDPRHPENPIPGPDSGNLHFGSIWANTNTKNIVFYCKSVRDPPFRVHETSAGVTVYRVCAQKLARARPATLGTTPLTPYQHRQDPYSQELFGD